MAAEIQRRERMEDTITRAFEASRRDSKVSVEILTAHLLMMLVRNG
jgi:hypothetical protein